jgi:hypothetical protein
MDFPQLFNKFIIFVPAASLISVNFCIMSVTLPEHAGITSFLLQSRDKLRVACVQSMWRGSSYSDPKISDSLLLHWSKEQVQRLQNDRRW